MVFHRRTRSSGIRSDHTARRSTRLPRRRTGQPDTYHRPSSGKTEKTIRNPDHSPEPHLFRHPFQIWHGQSNHSAGKRKKNLRIKLAGMDFLVLRTDRSSMHDPSLHRILPGLSWFRHRYEQQWPQSQQHQNNQHQNQKGGQIKNDQCNLIYLLLHIPDPGCADWNLPRTFLRMRDPLLRYLTDDRSHKHVLRNQQIPAPGNPILRTVRKHHGKSRYLQTTDQIR